MFKYVGVARFMDSGSNGVSIICSSEMCICAQSFSKQYAHRPARRGRHKPLTTPRARSFRAILYVKYPICEKDLSEILSRCEDIKEIN